MRDAVGAALHAHDDVVGEADHQRLVGRLEHAALGRPRRPAASEAATLHLSLRTASSTSSKASSTERSMMKVRRSG